MKAADMATEDTVQPAPLAGMLALLNVKWLTSSEVPVIEAGWLGGKVITQPGRKASLIMTPALGIVICC